MKQSNLDYRTCKTKKNTRFRFTNFKKLENKTSTKPTVAEVSAKFFLRHGVCFSRNLCQRSEKNFFALVLKHVRKVFDKSLKSLSDDSHASKVFFVEARVPFFGLEKVFETVPEQKKVLLLACQGSKIFGYSRNAKQSKKDKTRNSFLSQQPFFSLCFFKSG
jgi:hypothetical protein